MTPNQAVTKGLQKLGVLSQGEAATGQELIDGIDLLNQMLHSWEINGVDLQHYDASSGDALPFPSNHDVAIIFNFAVFAASDYEREPSATTVAIATDSLKALRNAYLNPEMTLRVDTALLPRYSSSYDITTDN